jgi:hypothetical protein
MNRVVEDVGLEGRRKQERNFGGSRYRGMGEEKAREDR